MYLQILPFFDFVGSFGSFIAPSCSSFSSALNGAGMYLLMRSGLLLPVEDSSSASSSFSSSSFPRDDPKVKVPGEFGWDAAVLMATKIFFALFSKAGVSMVGGICGASFDVRSADAVRVDRDPIDRLVEFASFVFNKFPYGWNPR